MNDAPKVLRDWLIEQPAIEALFRITPAGAYRIYAETANPPAGYRPTQGVCLCFKVRGGVVSQSDALLLPSVQFIIFGLTEYAAQGAYRAVFDALHNGRGAVMRWAQCESLGVTLADPDTGWPFVLSFWKISISKD
jgi:hypothetical protein